MKRALYTAQIDMAMGQFTIGVPDPAICIHVRIIQPKQPPMVPVIQMVFIVDPDATVRDHHFLALPEWMIITGDGVLEYRGTTSDPRSSGDKVIAIFEETGRRSAEIACDGDAHAFVSGHEWCVCGAEHHVVGDVTVPLMGEEAL